MAFDIDKFRHDFPEFCDEEQFLETSIQFWSTLGVKVVSEETFGDAYTEALSLFVAHFIIIQSENIASAVGGGKVGVPSQTIASKSVGSASISYASGDTNTELNAGHWNATTYGKQYIAMARLFGCGGMHI